MKAAKPHRARPVGAAGNEIAGAVAHQVFIVGVCVSRIQPQRLAVVVQRRAQNGRLIEHAERRDQAGVYRGVQSGEVGGPDALAGNVATVGSKQCVIEHAAVVARRHIGLVQFAACIIGFGDAVAVAGLNSHCLLLLVVDVTEAGKAIEGDDVVRLASVWHFNAKFGQLAGFGCKAAIAQINEFGNEMRRLSVDRDFKLQVLRRLCGLVCRRRQRQHSQKRKCKSK